MPKSHFTDNLRSVTPEEVAKKPVVSYFRVSTVGQGDSDKDGQGYKGAKCTNNNAPVVHLPACAELGRSVFSQRMDQISKLELSLTGSESLISQMRMTKGPEPKRFQLPIFTSV